MTQTVFVAGISASIGAVAYLFHIVLNRAGFSRRRFLDDDGISNEDAAQMDRDEAAYWKKKWRRNKRRWANSRR